MSHVYMYITRSYRCLLQPLQLAALPWNRFSVSNLCGRVHGTCFFVCVFTYLYVCVLNVCGCI
jgi:hypothetical protein